MRYARAWWPLMAVVILLLPACADPGDPDLGVDEADLTFLRFPPDLQPLVTQADSFYAVKGDYRELILRYQPEEPGEEGEAFLEFEVPGDALLRSPEGRLYREGDSVLIRVQVSPDGRFLFDFQPAGLRFDPDNAPRLTLTYERMGGDLDGDGDVDAEDVELEREIGLWRQEAPGEKWYPVGALKIEDLDEIEGEIFGFTGFAIAG